MEVDAPVLFHEIAGFTITCIMNSMPLLLQVMAEVQAAGSMPQPFSADNKQDFHGSLFSKAYVVDNDELLPGFTGLRRW
jgi:hypothetical protein